MLSSRWDPQAVIWVGWTSYCFARSALTAGEWVRRVRFVRFPWSASRPKPSPRQQGAAAGHRKACWRTAAPPGPYLVRFGCLVGHLHAGGPERHARNGDPGPGVRCGQQPLDRRGRHVPLDHIGSDEARVAAGHTVGHASLSADLVQRVGLLHRDGEPGGPQVLRPTVTTSTSRRLMNRQRPLGPCRGHPTHQRHGQQQTSREQRHRLLSVQTFGRSRHAVAVRYGLIAPRYRG
jgi:hypothetical protein